MYTNPAQANYRYTASPYEQLEPPFYLLPGEGSLIGAIGDRIKRLLHRCTSTMLDARNATALAHLDDCRLRCSAVRGD